MRQLLTRKFNLNFKCKPPIQYISLSMNKIINFAKQGIKKADLFSTSQFLRYKDEADYKTASGGVCSLIVIVVFMVLFMSTAIQTINMDIINWTQTTNIVSNPSLTTITMSPTQNDFMFAVGILGLDLNDPTIRYFDFFLLANHIIKGMNNSVGLTRSQVSVPLVPCTKQHFSASPDMVANFDTLLSNRWLCPPFNYAFNLYGKFTSLEMEYLQIDVRSCNSTLYPSVPCASNATLDIMQQQFGQFLFSIFYLNPLINPGAKDYLSFFMEDRNYIAFTRLLGGYSNGFIQDYTITTDTSLFPLKSNVVDSGVSMSEIFQNIPYQVTSDTYASYFLYKSSKSTDYQRSFNKIDTFFSYVGGLVGTILGFMLIVQSYTSMSFQLQLSQSLFYYRQNQPTDSSGFNLLTYCLYSFYQIGRYFGFFAKWDQMRKYEKCKSEISKQLDIQLILTRLTFLQKAAQVTFDQYQLQGLHLQKYDTLAAIKKRRRKYHLKKKIKSPIQHQEQSDNSSSQNDQHKSNTNQQVFQQARIHTSFKDQLGEHISYDSFAQIKKNSKRKEKNRNSIILNNLRKEGNDISLKIVAGMHEVVPSKNDQIWTEDNYNIQQEGISNIKNSQLNMQGQEVIIKVSSSSKEIGLQFDALDL